ncbi:MAG: hypothetical protein R3D66_00310 [Alphaproteobacteria bacterium]
MDEQDQPPEWPPQPPPGEDEAFTLAQEQGGSSYHAEIDPAYAQGALEKLRGLIRGNGIDPDKVELKDFKGETLEFLCATKLELKTKISEKRQAGKVTGPQIVGSDAMMREAIAREKSKIMHNADVIGRIRDVLLHRKDKGFNIHNELIKLPFLHKQFAHYEACNACKAKGAVPCVRCHGHGQEMCPRCHGNGFETCPQCNGNRQITGSQGKPHPCTYCHGQGKAQCRTCHQTRKVQCTVCRGRRTIPCKTCNGHAWNTHIAIVEIDAVGFFDYNRDALEERVVSVIEQLGPHLIDHVNARPVDMTGEGQAGKGQEEVYLPYLVHIPNGDALFTVDGEEVPAFIFGLQTLLIDMPPILEQIMEPGIKALEKAAAGQGDAAGAVRQACAYKTLRLAVKAAMKFSPKKAALALLKNTEAGLSDEGAEKLVRDAALALKNITRMPQRIGTALGLFLGAASFALYFLVLRAQLPASLPTLPGGVPAGLMVDLLVLAAGGAVTFALRSLFRKKALKRALGRLAG